MAKNKNHSSNSIAAILAGGKGTRLQPVISDVPKSLAPIAGEPFLFHLIRLLKSLGIIDILLLTGYMHEKIFDVCGNGNAFGVNIQYSREIEPLGTAGAIYHAKDILSTRENFLLLNGDTYYDNSILELIQHPLKEEMALIGVTKLNEPSQYGSIQIDATNFHIESFLEKNTTPTDYVSAGIYKFSKKILEKIPSDQMSSLEQDIFPELVLKKNILKAVVLNGQFHDIGVPNRYDAFNQKMISQGDPR